MLKHVSFGNSIFSSKNLEIYERLFEKYVFQYTFAVLLNLLLNFNLMLNEEINIRKKVMKYKRSILHFLNRESVYIRTYSVRYDGVSYFSAVVLNGTI